jgi:hypothetical protein
MQLHEKPQLIIQDLPVTLPICNFSPFKKEFNGSSNFPADGGSGHDLGRILDHFPLVNLGANLSDPTDLL